MKRSRIERKHRCAAAWACCLLAAALAGCGAPGSGTADTAGTAAEEGAPAESELNGVEDGESSAAEMPAENGLAEASDSVSEAAKALLADGISYYGEAGECRMSGRQAAAFAEVLRSELAAAEQKHARMEDMDPEVMDELLPVCGAALIDTGNGLPVLFVAGGSAPADTLESGSQDWERVSSWSIWQYEDIFGCVNDQYPALYPDHLLLTVLRSADDCDRNVYRYGDGVIEKEIAACAYLRGFENDGVIERLYVVDGQQTDKDAYDVWNGQWAEGAAAQFSFAADSPKGSFSGVTSAEKLIGVLTEYAETAGDGK